MGKHKVEAGDCFCSIAAKNGRSDYRTLYDHAENANLKNTRPNPNMLVPKDEVSVPALDKKAVPAAANKQHKFVVNQKKTRLRLLVQDAKGQPLAVKSCELSVGKSKSTAQPGNAAYDIDIVATERKGTFKATIAGWKPGAAPPAAVHPPTSPPAYPPPIVASEFEDKTDVPTGDDLEVIWTLHLGSLEPHATDRGCFQRLGNLGFNCPEADAESKATVAPVKAYQRHRKLTGVGSETGKLSDVRADLETQHDS